MTVSQRQLYNLIFTHDIHRCVFPTRLPAGIIERGKRECTKPLWQNVWECILEFTSSCPVVFYSCVGCFPKDLIPTPTNRNKQTRFTHGFVWSHHMPPFIKKPRRIILSTRVFMLSYKIDKFIFVKLVQLLI